MFELFVVAFLGYFYPSVSLQQLDDFRYFVLFHIKELLFDNAKVVKIILTCKFSAVKVLIIILFSQFLAILQKFLANSLHVQIFISTFAIAKILMWSIPHCVEMQIDRIRRFAFHVFFCPLWWIT